MFRTTLLARRQRTLCCRLSPVVPRITNTTSRPLSYTRHPQARKDAQGKDDLKPEPNEYSKSGSDDDAARVSDTAFSRDKTTPEEQHAHAEGESASLGQSSNPLDVSPANQEISKGNDPQKGGHSGSAAASGDSSSDRARTSGGGSPKKGSSGQKYSS